MGGDKEVAEFHMGFVDYPNTETGGRVYE